jgi:hypothetical protein
MILNKFTPSRYNTSAGVNVIIVNIVISLLNNVDYATRTN